MAERALHPDGVTVDSRALKADSDAKTFEIQRRHVDTGRSGRASGLEISLGTPASRFSFTAGYGYTPRGDYVEYGGVTNVALADYTSGVTNYVVLCYREISGSPEAHEDGTSTRDTIVTRSSELKVMTSTEYDAITPYYSADLDENLLNADVSTDTQDRMIILAVILGKGFTLGVANVYITADLTNGNVQQQSTFPVIITASQDQNTVSGVNLRAVSAGMSLGLGAIRYTESGSNRYLAFAEPSGSLVYGTATLITGSGTYDLPRSGGGRNLTVEVVLEAFPAVGTGTLTNDVTISNLYDDLGPIFSLADQLHRHELGANIPTAGNPHGLSPEDLAQQVLVFPQLFELGGDFLSAQSLSALARIMMNAYSAGRTCILNCGVTSAGSRLRLYRNSVGQLELTFNARYNGASWTKDLTTLTAQKYVFGPGNTLLDPEEEGLTAYRYDGIGDPFLDTAWTDMAMAVGGSVQLGTLLIDTLANSAIARIRVDRIDDAISRRTHVFTASGATSANTSSIDMYLASDGTDGVGPTFEICINAQYTPLTSTTGTWGRVASGLACKFDVTRAGISVFWFDATATASWNDASTGGGNRWRLLFRLDGSANTLDVYPGATFGGGVDAGGNLLVTGANQLVPRFRGQANAGGVPAAVQNRWLMHENMFAGAVGVRRYIYADNTPTYVMEDALNCSWDGTNWTCDDTAAPASLLRYTQSGTTQLYHAASGSGWIDSAWTRTNVAFMDGDTGASSIYNGVLRMTSPGDESNPAPGIGYTNSFLALNAPKAWGRFSCNPIAILDGFNVSLAEGADGYSCRVSFIDDLSDGDYVVVMQQEFESSFAATLIAAIGGGSSAAVTDTEWFRQNWVESQGASGFNIFSCRPDDLATNFLVFNMTDLNGESGPYRLNFAVFGRQT